MNANTCHMPNLLVGVTGSVATIKLSELVQQIQMRVTANICIVPTANALHFVDNFDLQFNKEIPELCDRLQFLRDTMPFVDNSATLKNNQTATKTSTEGCVFAFTDADEWSSWKRRNDPVLHIELRKWADLCVIAPLDANTLAKLSNGLSDNLLTCVLRAWDIDHIATKPVLICPAMNTLMYEHPLTHKQISTLVDDLGYTLVDSINKSLICGDVGIGAMATTETISAAVYQAINQANTLKT